MARVIDSVKKYTLDADDSNIVDAGNTIAEAD